MDTSCMAPSSKRRRRKMFVVIITVLALILLLSHNYLSITYNILFKGPYIATQRSNHLFIGQSHEVFDITFESYPLQPAPPSNITPDGHENLVPPIIHQIYLGPKGNGSAVLQSARHSCVEMHPGYQFMDWTDENSEQFVLEHFPELFPTWSTYRFVIQKADSLRYMILYYYGGIFLDLDLQCLRPLEPLRQFPFVAPAASPTGISNGFIMAAPHHPFFSFVLNNLPRYNIHWFGLPYAIVMFSTGCHFLTTMFSLYPERNSLRILWGPDKMHQLSGPITTPLFKHLGLSSWHSVDGAILRVLNYRPVALAIGYVLRILCFGAMFYLVWRWYRSRVWRKPWSWMNKETIDELNMA